MIDNNYCVYLHKSKETGEVFYVGKGRPKRPYELKGRSSAWKDFVENNNGFEVDIIKENLTNKEATILEADIISSGEYKLVNILKSHVVKEGILDVVDSFYYDTSSPTFLRWKSPLYMSNKKLGDVAGTCVQGGYATVYHKGRQLKAHRVIWVMHHRIEIPCGMVINHIDCDTLNNSIENLECVSIKQNNQRRKTTVIEGALQSGNTSGITGVSRLKANSIDEKAESYRYAAHIRLNDVMYSKSFAIQKYGEEFAKELAIGWRRAKQLELNGDRTEMDKFYAKNGDILLRDLPTGLFYTKDDGREYMIAAITVSSKTKRKKLSINKYGYEEAYRLACEWRKQMEDLYYNKPE